MYNEYLQLGDRLFVLYRKLQDNQKINTEILKHYWHCDTVLKKGGIFYFCNEIQTIEFEEL
jgi:Zn-dependent oligopeptidase